jgi:hypothetical protein
MAKSAGGEVKADYRHKIISGKFTLCCQGQFYYLFGESRRLGALNQAQRTIK